MALLVPNLDIPNVTTLENAYVRLSPMALDKTMMSFRVEIFDGEPQIDSIMVTCFDQACGYDLSSSDNPWKQAYDCLKDKLEFVDAQDV